MNKYKQLIISLMNMQTNKKVYRHLSNKPYMDNNLVSWYMNINYGLIKPLKWQKPIFKVLANAMMGNVSKILISAPPQHGKTMLAIEAFTSFYMVNNPDDKVIVTAYSQQRATKYGLNIRRIIEEFGDDTRYKPRLNQSQRSKTEFLFDYPYKGSLLAAGSHGSIMGNPANLIVVDDPVKELRDATSALMQENLDDWYVGSINTRLRKNDINRRPILLVVAQRLNKKDLHGILQDKYKLLDGVDAMKAIDKQEYIPSDTIINLNFPALCENKETDILHREKGEALWSNHKSKEDLMIDRKMMGEYRFKTIMQGDPQNIEDYLFNHDMFYDEDNNLTCTIDIYDVPAIPIGRFWDTAAQKTNKTSLKKHGDYYAGIQVGYDGFTKTFYVFDLKHGKDKALNVANLIHATAIDDGFEKFTYIAQEPGSMSLLFLQKLEEALTGYKLYYQVEQDNKLFKSMELQSVCNRHGLKFVTNPNGDNTWIDKVIKELCKFDGTESDARKDKHDDIVDALSNAINYFYLNKHLYDY